MSNINNDAYLLFLKQQQLWQKNQAANINKELQTQNELELKAFLAEQNIDEAQNTETASQDNFLERDMNLKAQQNQMDMTVKANIANKANAGDE